MKHRMFVFAVVMAAVLAVPTPARPATKKWSSPIWWSAVTGVPSGLTTDAHGAVVTTDAGEVRALRFDGTTAWVATVGGAEHAHPAVGKDLVLVGAAGRVVALGRRDGKVRWQQPMDGPVLAVALAGEYALAGGTGGTLQAFTASTGVPAWSTHWEGELSSPPQVDLGASVVVAIWNQLPSPSARGLDLATGTLRWEQAVGLYTAAPALDRGRAVVATGDGHFHAWVASIDVSGGPGADTWWVDLNRSFQAGVIPAVDAHDLVVVDHEGRVIALDPASGALRWACALNVSVMNTRVLLLARRVVAIAGVGQVFVLDRASGQFVAEADSHDFDGVPVLVASSARSDRMLVALRRSGPGTVEMHRVP